MNSLRMLRVFLLPVSIIITISLSNVFSETEKAPDKATTSSLQTPAEVKSFVSSQTRKGKIAYRNKDYSLAVTEWKKALEVDPHNSEVQQLVSMTEIKIQESASTAPKDSTAVVPSYKKQGYVQNQIRLGKLAYRKKDYPLAYSELKKGEAVDPQNTEIKRLLDTITEKAPDVVKTQSAQEITKPSATEASAPSTTTQEEPLAEERSWESEFLKTSESFEKLPGEGLPLTLEQCITIARANSLTVKVAREEAALARWKMAPARRALWPSFDAYWKETRGTTTGQDFTGREITLEFQKPLITWGKTKALFLQAKLNWEIAKRNLQKEVTELDFKVEQAYFILANAQKDVEDLRQFLQDANKDLKVAEQRYKLELSRELEWLKAKSKVDEIDYRVQSAEKDLILAQLTMAQVLDSRNQNPFTVQAKLGPYGLETTLDQCVELALKNRSDLIVNELLIEYNRLGQKIARSDYKWNVNLEGSVGMNDEAFISESLDMKSEWFVGVKVTKPFGPHTLEDNFIAQDKVPSVGQTTSTQFQSNTLKWYFWNSTAKINIIEADIKYLKAIDEYVKKRNSIIFEVKKNYYEYLKAKQQIENNRQKLKVSEEEAKISVARLGLNEILDSELLDAKDRLSRAKSEYGQSLTGYYTSVANVNKSIGLTDYFDLKRGIEEGKAQDQEAWKLYFNDPGDIGNIPNTEGFQEFVGRMEGKKPWWQLWGGSSGKPQTSKDLAEKTVSEGIVLYRQGNYQEALNKFEAAQQLDPENSKAKSYIRNSKVKLGQEVDEPGEQQDFSSKPSEKEKWFNEGLEAYQNKQYDSAVTALNKAAEIDPSDRRTQTYLQRAKDKLSKTQAQNTN